MKRKWLPEVVVNQVIRGADLFGRIHQGNKILRLRIRGE